MTEIAESDLQRFHKKIDKSGDCWEWIGAKKPSGYGNFWLNGKYVNAHKFSALAYKILTDMSLQVLHRCDNKSCVSPDHLYQGTHQQNVQDALDRDRYKPWRRDMQVCSRGHKMTEENVKCSLDGRNRCYSCIYLRDAGLRYRETGHRPNQARVLDKLASLGYSVDKMIEEFGQTTDGE